MTIHFHKMTAAGNDFICIDNTAGRYDAWVESPGFRNAVTALCARGTGVSADGVIVSLPLPAHPLADIRARFFEPDGSEAELCGNGTACFAEWALATGQVTGKNVTILTAAGIAKATRLPETEGRIRVCIPPPRDLRMGVRVTVGGREWELDTLIAGVPHAVAYVQDLEDTDVHWWGKLIRWHPAFQPRGINANFVKILEEGHLAIRTFEFGVEAETLACGTGSAASAIASSLRMNWADEFLRGDRPVMVDVRGQETVKVWFICDGADRIVRDVCLETRVVAVYEGEVHPGFLPVV